MSENKNDMSFADKIARVNRHNMQAVADAHNNLLKRVEVLEQENREQWDFMIALSNDMARIKDVEERLDILEKADRLWETVVPLIDKQMARQAIEKIEKGQSNE